MGIGFICLESSRQAGRQHTGPLTQSSHPAKQRCFPNNAGNTYSECYDDNTASTTTCKNNLFCFVFPSNASVWNRLNHNNIRVRNDFISLTYLATDQHVSPGSVHKSGLLLLTWARIIQTQQPRELHDTRYPWRTAGDLLWGAAAAAVFFMQTSR